MDYDFGEDFDGVLAILSGFCLKIPIYFFASTEYHKWRDAIDQANMAVPSLDFVKDKSKEILNAANYKWKVWPLTFFSVGFL